VITTLIGRQIGFDEFRSALAKAKILPFAPEHTSHTSYLPLGCSDLLCPHGAK